MVSWRNAFCKLNNPAANFSRRITHLPPHRPARTVDLRGRWLLSMFARTPLRPLCSSAPSPRVHSLHKEWFLPRYQPDQIRIFGSRLLKSQTMSPCLRDGRWPKLRRDKDIFWSESLSNVTFWKCIICLYGRMGVLGMYFCTIFLLPFYRYRLDWEKAVIKVWRGT